MPPVDVLKALENLAPKTLLLSRKSEYKNLLVLPVNVDKFQIAPTAVQWLLRLWKSQNM